MKIALVTDTHFGARSDSLIFDQYFEKFYSEEFFPYLHEHDIKKVIHLGDVFDRRKFVNFQILRQVKRYFFDKLNEFDAYIIAGNHDTALKNTNEINSIDLLLREYPNIKNYSELEYVDFDGTKILLMPWICAENHANALAELKSSKSDIVFGHFEISGFEMYRGSKAEGGLNAELFDRFDVVASGHFHHKSTNGNITYLGTPYEITWSDYDDPRGFHIFDTETRELTFIENPNKMFIKFHYNESVTDTDLMDLDVFTGKCVKIIVVNKHDLAKFDRFIERIQKRNPIDLKIVEDFSEFEANALDDENIDVSDTFTLLSSFVDAIETDANKDRLKDILKSLYIESMNSESA